MQVYHVNKNMVEQSLALSIYKEYLNHTLGLTLSTPDLVFILNCQAQERLNLNSQVELIRVRVALLVAVLLAKMQTKLVGDTNTQHAAHHQLLNCQALAPNPKKP